MRYPKPWKIGKVDLDPPSELPNIPRLSTVEIIDADEQIVCTIRTYSQPVVREIVDTINEYDKSTKIKECEDCLYYIKDILTGYSKCKYPLQCHNKHLFKGKDEK